MQVTLVPAAWVRTESRGRAMLSHPTDVRGERVVLVQVNWYG
ncbi:hypothetical protein [Streptomyces xanthochromogenes]|nr:hypothetical protein [Streptomyces xanthochromogenes]